LSKGKQPTKVPATTTTAKPKGKEAAAKPSEKDAKNQNSFL